MTEIDKLKVFLQRFLKHFLFLYKRRPTLDKI